MDAPLGVASAPSRPDMHEARQTRAEAPPVPSGSVRKKGTGGEDVRRRVGRGFPLRRALTPRQSKARSPSLFEHQPRRRAPICGMARGPRLLFQAKSLLIRAIARAGPSTGRSASASAHRRAGSGGPRFRRSPMGDSRGNIHDEDGVGRAWRRPRRAGRLGFWACSWRARSCASVKGRRWKPDRDAGVSGATLSRAALTSLCPAPGREARGRARGPTIAADGLTTPVRTNVEALQWRGRVGRGDAPERPHAR